MGYPSVSRNSGKPRIGIKRKVKPYNDPPVGEHTPGPWTVYPDDPYVIIAGRGFSICETYPGNQFDISNVEGKANARRIAAAVNACEGVPIIELENLGTVKCNLQNVAGVAQMAILNENVQAERDRLLIMLQRVLDDEGSLDFRLFKEAKALVRELQQPAEQS